MKILYSDIKKLVPGLKVSSSKVAQALTLTGLMVDSFEKVRYQGREDYLMGLEVRQNRPDCLSIAGVAREVAGYYGLPLKMPSNVSLKEGKNKLNIEIEAKDFVKRVVAVKFDQVENKESPKWLKEFLSFYGIHSINLLVDLSNYVMLFTGYPSHLFDGDKLKGNLSWSLNKNFKEIVTLDGSEIKLNKKELVIKDDESVLGLAGIVGGRFGKIEKETKTVVMEMAVYDHVIVMRDSRNLNVITEASNRLTKNLDPKGIDFASKYLISLILENCKGKIDSNIFDYYPKKENAKEIIFDPESPGKFAGIDIPKDKAVKILKNLSFDVKSKGKKTIVTPPVGRTDVSLKEDLIEEVVRIYGYDKIPSSSPPEVKVVENITPENIILSEKARDVLCSLGFDEVLSWPVTKEGENEFVNYLDWEKVVTENSINEDYPELRQSTITGLLSRFYEYSKKNIEYVKIFETGKVFGKAKGEYKEHDALGIFLKASSQKGEMNSFKSSVETFLRLIGLSDISYKKSKNNPEIANPFSCWSIESKDKKIGILYKLRPNKEIKDAYFAEFNIDEMVKILKKTKNKPAIELDQKLVVLDANIELKKEDIIYDFLKEIKDKIGTKYIWSINIIDEFPVKEKIKYTIRVSYKNLSDKDAKEVHLKTFNLKEK